MILQILFTKIAKYQFRAAATLAVATSVNDITMSISMINMDLQKQIVTAQDLDIPAKDKMNVFLGNGP
jgi:hypothetical protein